MNTTVCFIMGVLSVGIVSAAADDSASGRFPLRVATKVEDRVRARFNKALYESEVAKDPDTVRTKKGRQAFRKSQREICPAMQFVGRDIPGAACVAVYIAIFDTDGNRKESELEGASPAFMVGYDKEDLLYYVRKRQGVLYRLKGVMSDGVLYSVDATRNLTYYKAKEWLYRKRTTLVDIKTEHDRKQSKLGILLRRRARS